MFDTLEQIQENWNAEKPIIIQENEVKNGKSYFVLPGERVSTEFLRFIKQYVNGVYCNTVPHEFLQLIKLPMLQPMYANLENIYFELSYYNRTISDKNSLSINHVSANTGNSYSDIEATYVYLYDIVQEYYTQSETNTVIKQKFFREYSIPGRVELCKSHPKLLMEDLSIHELAIALTQITDQYPSIAILNVVDSETLEDVDFNTAIEIGQELDLLTIDSKYVRNMWRMLKKIPKGKIKKYEL